MVELSQQLLQLLQTRATAVGRSAEDYLRDLLDEDAQATAAPNVELFQRIVENSPNPALVLHAGMGITYANPATLTLLGLNQGAAQPLSWETILALTHPEDRLHVFHLIDATITPGNGQHRAEFRIKNHEGLYCWVVAHLVPLPAANPAEAPMLLLAVREVQEQKQAIVEREMAQKLLRSIFHRSQDAVLMANDDARYIEVNPAACAMLGYTQGELLGKSIWEITPERYQGVGQAAWEEFRRRGEQDGHYVLQHKNGREVIVEFMAMRDVMPGIHLSVLRDITRRIQMQTTLHASEMSLRSLLESQTAYILRVNMNSEYSFVNQRFADHYGWLAPDGNLIGYPIWDTVYAEDHAEMTRVTMLCMASPGEPHQVILRKPAPSGDLRWTLWEFVGLANDDGEVDEIQCMGFDITDHQVAQEQLRLQYTALEAATNAIAITDHNGLVLWVNAAFTSLTGYTLEEARGQSIGELQRSGMQNDAFYDELWQTILSGRAWSNILVNRRKDGSLYTEEQLITPVEDEDGNITHFIAIKQDVTERERNEQIKLDYEQVKARFAREREQNALIQRIISALSHDLRTPLAVIQTAKDKLARYHERLSEQQRQDSLETIERQVQFTVSLLDDTVQMARGRLLEADFSPSLVNLALICQVSVDEIATTTDKHQLAFVNQSGLQVVSVDELLVSRILLNLLSNAVKYSPGGGGVQLELDEHDEWIVLRVSDEGIGIREEDLQQIFEPFFRAEDAYEINGTGLGLSIVKDCVQRHRGRIYVRSVYGEGSTFTVELPRHSEPAAR